MTTAQLVPELVSCARKAFEENLAAAQQLLKVLSSFRQTPRCAHDALGVSAHMPEELTRLVRGYLL